MLDRELRNVHINATPCRFNGVTAQQALGHSVAEVLPNAFRRVEPLWRRVLDTGEAVANSNVSVKLPDQPDVMADWVAQQREPPALPLSLQP